MKSKNIQQGIFYSIVLDMALVRRALKKLGLGLEKTQDNNFDFCARNVALKAFSLNKFQ